MCANVHSENKRFVNVAYTKTGGSTIEVWFGYRYGSLPHDGEESEKYVFTPNSGTSHLFSNNRSTIGCVNAYMRVAGQGTFRINNVCP